jgi:DNA-directed RNA polymerase subunit beta'
MTCAVPICDSNLLPSELVERVMFVEDNRGVVSVGGKPASGQLW